jgi:hypothetical protein
MLDGNWPELAVYVPEASVQPWRKDRSGKDPGGRRAVK